MDGQIRGRHPEHTAMLRGRTKYNCACRVQGPWVQMPLGFCSAQWPCCAHFGGCFNQAVQAGRQMRHTGPWSTEAELGLQPSCRLVFAIARRLCQGTQGRHSLGGRSIPLDRNPARRRCITPVLCSPSLLLSGFSFTKNMAILGSLASQRRRHPIARANLRAARTGPKAALMHRLASRKPKSTGLR